MKHLKQYINKVNSSDDKSLYETYEDKLKKFIEIHLLNLIIICELITETPLHITVKKLYTYDTINKTLNKNNKDEIETLIYDNFTKETIGKQSNNLNNIIDPLEIEQNTNKFNL